MAFSVAGGDSASAWAAGCPVIVKVRSHHAWTYAYAPLDVFPIVHPPPQAHDAHPGISEYVATIIADAAERFDMEKMLHVCACREAVKV